MKDTQTASKNFLVVLRGKSPHISIGCRVLLNVTEELSRTDKKLSTGSNLMRAITGLIRVALVGGWGRKPG